MHDIWIMNITQLFDFTHLVVTICLLKSLYSSSMATTGIHFEYTAEKTIENIYQFNSGTDAQLLFNLAELSLLTTLSHQSIN